MVMDIYIKQWIKNVSYPRAQIKRQRPHAPDPTQEQGCSFANRIILRLKISCIRLLDRRPHNLNSIVFQAMTRRANKFDTKMPTPIALSKKPPSRVDLETRLRKIDQEFQQDQQFVPSSSSNFMISNLKQELSHIKQDVEKLMLDEEYQSKPLKVETNSTLKEQLAHQKQLEEQLRKQIKDLRTRNSEVKSRDDKTGYMAKQIQVLKREQGILQKEKEEALQALNKLKRELSSAKPSESLQIQLSEYKRKYERQKQEKQQLEALRRRLELENSRLMSQVSSRTKEREQLEGVSSEWKQQKYNMERQISRLKLALNNALNSPEWKQEKIKLENEVSKLKMQIATSLSNSNNQWKEEKSRLEAQITRYRQLSTSSGDQWREQKAKLENEISKLQVQSKRNKELLESRYKTNKDEMVSSINSIKDLTEKNYQFVRKINNMEGELSQKSEQLRKKEQLVLQQKEEIRTINKEKDTRYNNLMNEFRRLQQTLNKSAQENLVGMKNTIFSLENAVRNEQADKQKMRYTIAELTQKIQRLNFSISEEKKNNEDLQQKIKMETKNYQDKQLRLQKRLSSKIDELQRQLEHTKRDASQKDSLMAKYVNQIKDLESYKNNQQKLKLLQIQRLDASLQTNQLTSQVIALKQTIQSLEAQLNQKNKVIQRLSQSTTAKSSSNEIQIVEAKYKEIIQQQNHTIEESQLTIMRLQNQISQLKESSKKVQVKSPKNSSFDDIFKEHIKENEQLKLALKNKTEEIFTLKNSIEDHKRKIDFQRNQSEIDKLKNISDQKKIKNHYEIQIQNMQADVESQKRKHQALQARLDAKVDELKKKDEFIQSVIIGKVGRDAYSSELEYITKEVNKFFNVNYAEKLVVAEDEIKILKEKVRALESK